MDRMKHPLTDPPRARRMAHFLTLALQVAQERGLSPDAWSSTNLGLDSASAEGLLLWAGPEALTAIDPTGHMYWYVPSPRPERDN